MGKWNNAKIESVCEIITKKGRKINFLPCINMDNIDAGTGQLLGVADTDIKSDKIAFGENDILFGKLRPYLKKYWHARFDGLCTSEFLVFRAKPYIKTRYLYYIVSTDGFVAFNNSQAFGTKMPRTSWGIAKKYEFVFPNDETEQCKIAEVLTTVDTAIEKTRALIEKYKNIKTGLMQDLLTNGIDEHGNIRSPQTHEYKDSPLGRIPVEWDCTFIRDISIKVGSGATPRGGQTVYTNDGIIFLRSQNITFDGITLEDAAYITKQIHRQMRRSHVEKNDVLLNITGASIGRCCIYESDDEANVNQHVCIIRTSLGAEYARFNYWWLCSYGQSQIGLLMAGGNREGLNFEQIKNIKLPMIKDPAELTAINTALNRQDNKIQSEQAYLTKLLNIKQGLMRDLLTHTVPVDALL